MKLPNVLLIKVVFHLQSEHVTILQLTWIF